MGVTFVATCVVVEEKAAHSKTLVARYSVAEVDPVDTFVAKRF